MKEKYGLNVDQAQAMAKALEDYWEEIEGDTETFDPLGSNIYAYNNSIIMFNLFMNNPLSIRMFLYARKNDFDNIKLDLSRRSGVDLSQFIQG